MISKDYRVKKIYLDKNKKYPEFLYYKCYLLFGLICLYKTRISFTEFMEMDYERGEK